MMKAVLFAAGASVVVAQFESCYTIGQNNMDNCTTGVTPDLNCSITPGSCYRQTNANVTACSTDSKTCSGANCAMGTLVRNYTSCSKCVDQCAGMTSETGCGEAPACAWLNRTCQSVYVPPPTPPAHCSGLTSQSTCTASENCFWWSASHTACGVAETKMGCAPCNVTSASIPTLAERSALRTQIGKTCTFAKSGGYDSDFVITLNAIEQNAMCGTWNAAMMDDLTTVTRVVRAGIASGIANGFAEGTTPVCTQASSAAALLPSLAFLGLVMFSA